MKIIFCTDGIFPYQVGGMQRHSRLLIEQLAKTGQVQLTVLHPHPEKIFSPDLNIQEEQIVPIDKTKNYLLECYRYSKRVYEIIKHHPGSIIYSQGLSVWYNIKKIKSPLIINPHGLEPYQCLTTKEKIIAVPFKLIFNYLFNNATRVISLGGKLTEILNKKVRDKNKIRVIPNAVNIEPNTGPKKFINKKIKLLFVSRFAHNKGIHILLEAVKQLNDENYSDMFEFNLGGKGPLFEYYSTNYVYKNVNYLGFISDEQLIELYKSNDLFVFPTLFEGMPTVVLEAMSYGMPVIVSDVGATSELVSSKNGFLINKNSVPELKKAIIDFYLLPAHEKEKLSAYSYDHVLKNYTWNIAADKHLELFKSLS
ncbi:MAG: glycosyltransferase family 4 protein [Bacteroidia bacterium]